MSYPPASATDAVTTSPGIVYSHRSGEVFPLGNTAVTVTATDAAGNSTAGTFNVLVRELQSLCLDVELINKKAAEDGAAQDGVGEAIVTSAVEA